jgi:hypothetical protein
MDEHSIRYISVPEVKNVREEKKVSAALYDLSCVGRLGAKHNSREENGSISHIQKIRIGSNTEIGEGVKSRS